MTGSQDCESVPSQATPDGVPQRASTTPDLALELAPALERACDGRLSNIEWFRSSWSRGGASTGYAKYARTDDDVVEVVVKVPVSAQEMHWTSSLGEESDGPTPSVLASGDRLDGHDVCWLVIEKLEGTPLNQDLNKKAVQDLLDTLVAWYAAASTLRAVQEAPPEPDWDHLLAKARTVVKESNLENGQHWNQAIHHVQRVLPRLVAAWRARPIHTWCHGDVHPANAMRRADGRCVLLDLSLVHAGHWVEDAVYLERQYWGHEDRIAKVKPVKILAKALKDSGLRFEEDHTHLANVRRLLTAACVPAFAAREWTPTYAQAALELIDRLLPQLTR